MPFGWKFGVGSTVVDKGGHKHKVVRFESEGMVTIKDAKHKQYRTIFGGALTEVKAPPPRTGLEIKW